MKLVHSAGYDDSRDEGPEGWMHRGSCLHMDPDLFFPPRGASTVEAKQSCAACPVREQCLEYALVNCIKFGIWGGLSERERRRLRRERRVAPAFCGSCGAPLTQPPAGRVKEYCGNACILRARRAANGSA